MATTDYDFTLTRQELLEAAFRKLGILPAGDPMDAQMSANGVQALNLLMKQWNSEGIHFWSTAPGLTISLSNDQVDVTFEDDPFVIGVESAFIRENDKDEEVEIISMQKYEAIYEKAKKGKPQCLFVRNLANSTIGKLWPVSDGSYTLRYTGITRTKDWDNSIDSNLVPERFLMALLYGLCAFLSEDYRLPAGERDSFRRQYDYYFSKARQSDRNRDDNSFIRGAYER